MPSYIIGLICSYRWKVPTWCLTCVKIKYFVVLFRNRITDSFLAELNVIPGMNDWLSLVTSKKFHFCSIADRSTSVFVLSVWIFCCSSFINESWMEFALIIFFICIWCLLNGQLITYRTSRIARVTCNYVTVC